MSYGQNTIFTLKSRSLVYQFVSVTIFGLVKNNEVGM